MVACPSCGQPLSCEDVTELLQSEKTTYTPLECVNPECSKSPLFVATVSCESEDDGL